MEHVNKLLSIENEKGVYDIDTENITSIDEYQPGYVDRERDIIKGLQTDAPLKRAINPFAGKRMCEQACRAYGYEMSDKIREAFKYRTTHNDGVFRVYTDLMRKARHCGLITGLPDAYARGRIIGDYRRVALYGMDFLIEEKKKDKAKIGNKTMTAENIQLLEDISKQIEFMKKLIVLASQYGCDITKPAQNFREAVQWLYFGYLGAVKEQNGAANSIGRITTFLDIYAERDLAEGSLTEDEAQEIIDDLVIKLRLVRHLRTPEYNEIFAGDPTWVTSSEGGLTVEGKSMVTKTNFRMLNTLYNLGSSAEPNITILWSEKLPQGFKKLTNSSFNGCILLRSVTLPESLEDIVNAVQLDGLFGTTRVRSVLLPYKLKFITKELLSNSQIKNFIIPDYCQYWLFSILKAGCYKGVYDKPRIFITEDEIAKINSLVGYNPYTSLEFGKQIFGYGKITDFTETYKSLDEVYKKIYLEDEA